jgi:hypothetical protein
MFINILLFSLLDFSLFKNRCETEYGGVWLPLIPALQGQRQEAGGRRQEAGGRRQADFCEFETSWVNPCLKTKNHQKTEKTNKQKHNNNKKSSKKNKNNSPCFILNDHIHSIVFQCVDKMRLCNQSLIGHTRVIIRILKPTSVSSNRVFTLYSHCIHTDYSKI